MNLTRHDRDVHISRERMREARAREGANASSTGVDRNENTCAGRTERTYFLERRPFLASFGWSFERTVRRGPPFFYHTSRPPFPRLMRRHSSSRPHGSSATSFSRTSSQTIALGVRAAFGDTPSATVGESWYGAHTTLSSQAGRRRAAFCYPTNAAVLYDRVQDRPSDAGARHERSSPSRRAGGVSSTS